MPWQYRGPAPRHHVAALMRMKGRDQRRAYLEGEVQEHLRDWVRKSFLIAWEMRRSRNAKGK